MKIGITFYFLSALILVIPDVSVAFTKRIIKTESTTTTNSKTFSLPLYTAPNWYESAPTAAAMALDGALALKDNTCAGIKGGSNLASYQAYSSLSKKVSYLDSMFKRYSDSADLLAKINGSAELLTFGGEIDLDGSGDSVLTTALKQISATTSRLADQYSTIQKQGSTWDKSAYFGKFAGFAGSVRTLNASQFIPQAGFINDGAQLTRDELISKIKDDYTVLIRTREMRDFEIFLFAGVDCGCSVSWDYQGCWCNVKYSPHVYKFKSMPGSVAIDSQTTITTTKTDTIETTKMGRKKRENVWVNDLISTSTTKSITYNNPLDGTIGVFDQDFFDFYGDRILIEKQLPKLSEMMGYSTIDCASLYQTNPQEFLNMINRGDYRCVLLTSDWKGTTRAGLTNTILSILDRGVFRQHKVAEQYLGFPVPRKKPQ